jgi:tetratricopeptide (TPR) repeat protein
MKYLLVFLAALVLHAQGPFDGKSGPLVKAAYQLLDKGQYNEAAAKFEEAAKTDPKASYPLSGLAKLFFSASQRTDGNHQAEYRSKAMELARQALELNDLDFVANEVLLNADGASADSEHKPKPDAMEAFNAAEEAFRAEKWDEAAAGYQKALTFDPAFTDAALYLGDVYFRQQQYEKAEPWFRKATQLEPRYSRAWRFLTDCYGHMGRVGDAMAADFGAIAAQPDDYTAWGRLRQVYEAQTKIALIRFRWPATNDSQVSADSSGEVTIGIPDPKADDTPEGAALNVFTLLDGLTKAASDEKRSELMRQVEVWDGTLEAYERALDEKKAAPKDAAWAQLLAFHKSDQLKAALFLLRFHESYRLDFEAWKMANPKGVQAFIEQWHLRP